MNLHIHIHTHHPPPIMKTITRYIDSIKSDIVYHIGQNAFENFALIDTSNESDLWFHIESAPSCHVVASISDHIYDKKQLHKIAVQGAMLCKQNSRFRADKKVSVVYCHVADIIKQPTIGTVLFRTTPKNIVI